MIMLSGSVLEFLHKENEEMMIVCLHQDGVSFAGEI